jgi:hypothetical protein
MTERDPDEDVQQAQGILNNLAQSRVWAIRRAAEYRLIAEFIEDEDVDGVDGDADELRQAADTIEQVAERIN